MRSILLILVFAVNAHAQNNYVQSIRTWDSMRIVNLKAENGWLNLVGLHFLPRGKTSFPAGMGLAAYFEVTGNAVSITTEVPVTINGKQVQQAIIYQNDSATEVRYGPLKWTIIKRDGQFAIRLRNLQSPSVQNFKGIERYPIDANWNIKATMQENVTPVFIPITNILGTTSNQQSPGKLTFTINGKQYTLDALDGGKDELFIIFGDETNGDQTYPSGRYMYIKRPGADGVTYLDFNKAYNPPCAFTTYATCPLPPKQNILPIAITAGEKNYAGH